jgi:hypothetical protein
VTEKTQSKLSLTIDHEFKASLGYTVIPCLKAKQNRNKQKQYVSSAYKTMNQPSFYLLYTNTDVKYIFLWKKAPMTANILRAHQSPVAVTPVTDQNTTCFKGSTHKLLSEWVTVSGLV